jgi:membrane protein DedA with SNARE-associated domain
VQIFNQIVLYLEQSALVMPLELFIFVGSFIEEVIAPIPSPFILTLSGTIAAAKSLPLIALPYLALIGALGKTLGAWVLYYITDKLEDVILSKYGKFFGVTHKSVENIGKKFGKGWKDFFILLGLRSLPVVPSAPVSIVCGLIKINIKTYLTASFIGTFIRNSLFLYFGYAGVSSYQHIVSGLSDIESKVQLGLFVAVLGFIAYSYYKRYKKPID